MDMSKRYAKLLLSVLLTAVLVSASAVLAQAEEQGTEAEAVRNKTFTTYAQMQEMTGNTDQNAWSVRYLTEVEKYYWNFSPAGKQERRRISMDMVSNAYRNLEMFLDNGYLLDYNTLYEYCEDYKERKGEEDAYYLILTDCLKNPYLENRPRAIVTAATYNGRDYSTVFDADYYYNNNPDLQQKIGRDPAELLRNFVECGINEGRRGNESFDVSLYAELLDALVSSQTALSQGVDEKECLGKYSYSPANYYGRYLDHYNYDKWSVLLTGEEEM